MKDRILVVVADPGKPARTETIDNDLESLQVLVGGSIEMLQLKHLAPRQIPLPTSIRDVHLYMNEEGKLLELAPNLPLLKDVIVGTIVASRINGEGDEIGLSEEEAKDIAHLLDSVRGEPPVTVPPYRERSVPADRCPRCLHLLDNHDPSQATMDAYCRATGRPLRLLRKTPHCHVLGCHCTRGR